MKNWPFLAGFVVIGIIIAIAYWQFYRPEQQAQVQVVAPPPLSEVSAGPIIQHLVTGERQLFDLEKDPFELDNLINKPEFERLATRLQLELLEWRMGTPEK